MAAVTEQPQPQVLYEGEFWKKRQTAFSIPVVGTVLEMVPGLGWSKRYVRLYAGKIEWYKDGTEASRKKPLGMAPLGVFTPTGDFESIMSTFRTTDKSAPNDRDSLRVMFRESGEIKYRVGLGAHHAEYRFQPVLESVDAHTLEKECDGAAAAVRDWDHAVKSAALAALKDGKNPINAALTVAAGAA